MSVYKMEMLLKIYDKNLRQKKNHCVAAVLSENSPTNQWFLLKHNLGKYVCKKCWITVIVLMQSKLRTSRKMLTYVFKKYMKIN